MELEYTKGFLGFSHHFTPMSTFAFLMAIVGGTSLLPHATKAVPLLSMLAMRRRGNSFYSFFTSV
jgi:hypothetical protein